MNRIAYLLVALSVAALATATDAQARGGRFGGGGGFSRGGGGFSHGGGYEAGGHSFGGYSHGGYSRPTASRTPSMSRPSWSSDLGRGSSSRGRSHGSGQRSPGGRPTESQLDSFLNLSSHGAGRAGTGSKGYGDRAQGRGSGGSFLGEHSSAGDFGYASRQGRQGERSEAREGRQGDRSEAREGRQGERTEERGDRQSQRQTTLSNNQANRAENRQQLQQGRMDRADEVRNQFWDNHPRADFWQDNPAWARWHWTRPYRWATWGMIAAWGSGYHSQPVYYDYGTTIYYEGDTVYDDGKPVASADEYAQQAETIATAAPEPAPDSKWLTLGVFALTQDGQASGPPPTIYVQLTVNKDGVIAGTLTHTTTNDVQEVTGSVDKQTQRCAWIVSGKKWPVTDTGIANLTKDSAPALLHFANGQTQKWLLVRVPDPKGDGQDEQK